MRLAALRGPCKIFLVLKRMHVPSTQLKSPWAAALLLLLLPLLLLSFHAFVTETIDDSRFQVNIDPDYQYLLSAIDLSRLDESRMVLHPGTTVQLLAHVLMKARFWITGSRAEDFATSVLRNPGAYLNLLHHAFSLVNIGLVWLFGFLAFKITQSMRYAFFFQSLPFLFAPLFIFGFRKVSSDVVLVSACLALAWLLLKTIHGQHAKPLIEKRLALSIAFGLLIGFGAATKITFAIMAVIPLVLIPTLVGKAGFLMTAGVGFSLFTLPAVSIFPRLGGFLGRILTHKGIYGRGRPSLFDAKDFAGNLWQLVRENFPFMIFMLLSVVVILFCLVGWARKGKSIDIWKEADFKALCAVTFAQLVNALMIMRHFKSKYLIPALGLTALTVYLLDRNLQWWNHLGVSNSRLFAKFMGMRSWILGTMIVVALLQSGLQLHAFYRQRQQRLNEARMIEKKLQGEFRGYAIVYYYNAASMIYGLKFGNDWTPLYHCKLQSLYGDQFFYNRSRRTLTGWNPKGRVALEMLRRKFNDRIVFYGSPFAVLEKKKVCKAPSFPLRDACGGEEITLYRYEH